MAFVAAAFFVFLSGAAAFGLEWPKAAEVSGAGRVSIQGGSFLEGGKLVKRGLVAPVKTPALRAWLVWSAELAEREAAPPALRVRTPQGERTLEAARSGWRQSTGWVYAGAVEATGLLSEGFTILPPRADPLHHGDAVPYSHAGWALLRVENPEGKSSRRVALRLGPEVLPPAQFHGLSLDVQGELREVGVVGGHGMPGNAAGNLLNGRPLTAGRDWAGAAGERWDVSLVAVSAKPPYRLQFDPLLQWLVPVAVVTVSEERAP